MGRKIFNNSITIHDHKVGTLRLEMPSVEFHDVFAYVVPETVYSVAAMDYSPQDIILQNYCPFS